MWVIVLNKRLDCRKARATKPYWKPTACNRDLQRVLSISSPRIQRRVKIRIKLWCSSENQAKRWKQCDPLWNPETCYLMNDVAQSAGNLDGLPANQGQGVKLQDTESLYPIADEIIQCSEWLWKFSFWGDEKAVKHGPQKDLTKSLPWMLISGWCEGRSCSKTKAPEPLHCPVQVDKMA